MPSIYVATESQKILWLCELRGQLSDGAWENANVDSSWWKSPPEVSLQYIGVAGLVPKAFNFYGNLVTECDLSERMIFAVKVGLYLGQPEAARHIASLEDFDLQAGYPWGKEKLESRREMYGLTRDAIVMALANVKYDKADLKADLKMLNKICKTRFSACKTKETI